MDSKQLLGELAGKLLSGGIEVVDLSARLGPDTPLIKLPPELAADTPKIEIHNISNYDKNGPFWAWNWLKLGEHSGTHFDAPIHWVTGRDLKENACDTIPARRFVGPASVIDITEDVAQNPDFLVTTERIESWEREHGRIPAGAWVLLRTDWSRRKGLLD